MNRSLAFAVPVALALSFGATGCTIYTYSETPHSKKPGKAKPAGTTKPTSRVPRRPGAGADTADVPTVTSKTIFGGGAAGAFHGYAYVIPEGTTRLPNFDDLVPFAQLYTDQFDVPTQTFTGGFPGALLQDEWFAIRYTGKFLAPIKGNWRFRLNTDDGANLYIDGKKVLDIDGVHTSRGDVANVDLEAGQHTLQLDYFQEKKGLVTLQLYTVIGDKEVPLVGVR